MGYEMFLLFLLIYVYACCFSARSAVVACFSWVLCVFIVFVWLLSVGVGAGFFGTTGILLVLSYFGASVALLLVFSLHGAVRGGLRCGLRHGGGIGGVGCAAVLGLWPLMYCTTESSVQVVHITRLGGCTVHWFSGQHELILVQLLQDSSDYFLQLVAGLLFISATVVGVLFKQP